MDTVLGMATVAHVGKFKIGLFVRTASHGAPYFKAFLGDGKDRSASILIDTLEVVKLVGINARELKPVIEWAKKHQAELAGAWKDIQKITVGLPFKGFAPPYLVGLKPLKNLVLLLEFSNGEKRKIDFKKIDLLGALRPLKDQKFFDQVKLVGAFPTWPNGLDLDPDELWEIGEKETAASVSKLNDSGIIGS